jgi:hypothetical protein
MELLLPLVLLHLILLQAATILVGQAVSPVTAGSSRRFGCGSAAFVLR